MTQNAMLPGAISFTQSLDARIAERQLERPELIAVRAHALREEDLRRHG
jgi:hypothetical protein